jgi:hypothetical protein
MRYLTGTCFFMECRATKPTPSIKTSINYANITPAIDHWCTIDILQQVQSGREVTSFLDNCLLTILYCEALGCAIPRNQDLVFIIHSSNGDFHSRWSVGRSTHQLCPFRSQQKKPASIDTSWHDAVSVPNFLDCASLKASRVHDRIRFPCASWRPSPWYSTCICLKARLLVLQ